MLKKSDVLRQIREQCEKGIRYTNALKRINVNGVIRKVNPQTIENWRKKYPRIERYCLAIQKLPDIAEEKITDAVENKLKDRLLKGEASAAEYIFYLCNRRPDKWKRNALVNNTIINQNKVEAGIDFSGEDRELQKRIRSELFGIVQE